MSVVEISPTKHIREKLANLNLSESETRSRSNTTKNHLKAPKLVLNKDFDDKENSTKVLFEVHSKFHEDHGTVIHNVNDPDTTLPDWMKVKLQVNNEKNRAISGESEGTKVATYSYTKPQLVFTKEDDKVAADTTWEQFKRSYNIKDEDLLLNETGDVSQPSEFVDSQLNNSIYSFEDMPKISNPTQHSTIHTAKFTSFKSDFIDSPMAPPKLVKSIKFSVPTEPLQIDSENVKVPIKLITPTDLSMIFDSNEGKWVHPKDAVDTTSAFNNEVTSATDLDISFSQSKRALVSALTDVLAPNLDWDKVYEVDVSNKNLITMAGSEEFIPNLTRINVSRNQLNNFEGLSSNLQDLNISHNSICDHLTDFHKFEHLLSLDLSHNKISDMSIFTQLISLRELNLSHNKIKKIVNLTTVMKLDLSNNRIEGDLDFADYTFNWLWDLDISDNSIKSVNNFHMPALLSLKLKHNKLETFRIRKDMKLKKLDLSLNEKLTQFRADEYLSSLEILHIDGPVKVIGSFLNLTSLTIGNDIGQQLLKDKDFRVSRHLNTLNYIASGLSDEDYCLIQKKFPLLRNIDLSSNRIGGTFGDLLKFLNSFQSLNVIKLNSNPLLDLLKTEQDRTEFKILLHKIINNE